MKAVYTWFLVLSGVIISFNINAEGFDDYMDVLEEVSTEIGSERATEDEGNIRFSAEIEFGVSGYGNNDESRLNPNNAFYDLEKSGQALETIFEAEDRFGKDERARWFLKTHNFFDSELSSEEYGRLDEFFVDYQMDNLYAQIGKRRINWGHAFAFNPVNVVVPPRDLINPDQETEGRPMIWFQSSLGGWSMDVIGTRNYNSEFESDSSQWGARLTTVFGSTDMALYYFDGEDTSSGEDYPTLNGASFSTDIGSGTVIFGEYANFDYNDRNYYDSDGNVYRKDGGYSEYVVGFNSRFALENTILFEYFHSSGSYDKTDRVNFFNAVDTYSGGLPLDLIQNDYLFANMARNYAVLGYEKIYRENYQLLTRALVSEDESVYFGLIGSYQFASNYTFEIEWLQSVGGSDSEFGNSLRGTAFKLAIIATY